jgi:hypothetical protein
MRVLNLVFSDSPSKECSTARNQRKCTHHRLITTDLEIALLYFKETITTNKVMKKKKASAKHSTIKKK